MLEGGSYVVMPDATLRKVEGPGMDPIAIAAGQAVRDELQRLTEAGQIKIVDISAPVVPEAAPVLPIVAELSPEQIEAAKRNAIAALHQELNLLPAPASDAAAAAPAATAASAAATTDPASGVVETSAAAEVTTGDQGSNAETTRTSRRKTGE